MLSYAYVNQGEFGLGEQILMKNLQFHPLDTSTYNNLGTPSVLVLLFCGQQRFNDSLCLLRHFVHPR